jgi:hypothetical protein
VPSLRYVAEFPFLLVSLKDILFKFGFLVPQTSRVFCYGDSQFAQCAFGTPTSFLASSGVYFFLMSALLPVSALSCRFVQ